MPTTSPRLGLLAPVGTDFPSEYRVALANHAAALDGSIQYSAGTLAARPASPTVAPAVYKATDSGLTYWWDGLAWTVIPFAAVGRSAGFAQSLPLGNYPLNMGAGGGTFGTANITQNLTYSTSTGLFTVTLPGLYACAGVVNLALNASSQSSAAYWQLCLIRNGVLIEPGTAESIPTTAVAPFAGLTADDLVACAAGDTLGLQPGGEGMSNTVAISNYVLNVHRVG